MNNVSKVYAAELEGIDARLIEVETDVNVGLHSFTIVGLADKALSEAKERVNAALKHAGAKPPNRENRKIVVNLAPADVKKTGSQYDVAIAMGYLLATEQIRAFDTHGIMFIGELALDGNLRSVSGVLSMVGLAKSLGFHTVVVPTENAEEAALIQGITILPAFTLQKIIEHFDKTIRLIPQQPTPLESDVAPSIRLEDIKGHSSAKRALTVAAAGGHHVLFSGPPGTGKTMLAQAMASILTPMTLDECIETTKIYSAAGLLRGQTLVSTRPFRAPHHTASSPAIVGGGANPRPGEASLAHHGVLFLDELPEFHRDVLESLRQPLESKTINISRAQGTLTFPARFALLASMNPCPCGYHGDSDHECHCTADAVLRYQKKVSGPLLDRIDIQIHVPRIDLETLQNTRPAIEGETTHARTAIVAARTIQQTRFKKLRPHDERVNLMNSDLTSRECDSAIPLTKEAAAFLATSFAKLKLSTRSYYRVLKIARTIADLDAVKTIDLPHMSEALSYRVRDPQVI